MVSLLEVLMDHSTVFDHTLHWSYNRGTCSLSSNEGLSNMTSLCTSWKSHSSPGSVWTNKISTSLRFISWPAQSKSSYLSLPVCVCHHRRGCKEVDLLKHTDKVLSACTALSTNTHPHLQTPDTHSLHSQVTWHTSNKSQNLHRPSKNVHWASFTLNMFDHKCTSQFGVLRWTLAIRWRNSSTLKMVIDHLYLLHRHDFPHV